ncbi:S1 family peptidase [Saccharopolyspora hattusasensis]|uniref:S1 family peptidase n=1 Tax=Saccharopolyspora hattusasensis TaxID=1128679 RepID=UPI003D974C62
MKRRLAARVAGTVMLAAGTVAALTMPATATATATTTETAPPASEAATLLDAMQRDLGLNRDEARQRLDQEAAANRAEQQLRGSLGGTFGGAYFDPASGKLVVGVTDSAAFDAVRAAGAEPTLVDYSIEELNGVIEGLNLRSTAAPKPVSGWYADSRANSVVVTTRPGSAVQAAQFVQSTGVLVDAVRVVESTENPRTLADVIGGNAYYIGSARCSVGFSVQGGFVTAGHCGNKGDTTSQPTGKFEGSSFPDNDYGWVRVGSGETPRPLVNQYNGSNVSVAGSTESAVGASICRSGSTTGWHCGSVQAKNQTVQYPQGTVTGLTRTDVCAEPGDSGGSWQSGNQAQGVTSGGSGNCSSGGTTYFQPVNEILQAYGLSLLTQ